MSAVSPRWEWRTFGDRFGALEERLRGIHSDPRKSADTYILSDRSDTNAKIRDSQLQIKTLQQIDAHGLELWMPSMSEAFPLTSESIDAVMQALGLATRAPRNRSWTPAAFLDEVVRPERLLTVVDVAKQRRVFVIDDCLVEISRLALDGHAVTTVAVEMTDSERVWRTVHALGLSSYENVNYVKALKRFVAVHST